MSSLRLVLGVCWFPPFPPAAARPQPQDALDQFREIADQAVVDKEVGGVLKALWEDVGVRRAYEMRHRFQLPDSAG